MQLDRFSVSHDLLAQLRQITAVTLPAGPWGVSEAASAEAVPATPLSLGKIRHSLTMPPEPVALRTLGMPNEDRYHQCRSRGEKWTKVRANGTKAHCCGYRTARRAAKPREWHAIPTRRTTPNLDKTPCPRWSHHT